MKKTMKYLFCIIILFCFFIINHDVVYAMDIVLTESEYENSVKNESSGKIYRITKNNNSIEEVNKEDLIKSISTKFKSNNQVQTTTKLQTNEAFLVNGSIRAIHPNAGNLIRMYRPFNSPYSKVCKITAGGDAGTGFLVGPNLLLTAAHCFFDEEGNVRSNWTCFPSYENGSYNNFSSGWQEATFGDWVQSGNASGDWCVIVLDWNMGNQLGWIGCQAYGTNSEMNEMTVHAAGYPEARQEHVNAYQYITQTYDGQYQYYSPGNILTTNNGDFTMSAYPIFGMSGGPVINWSTDMAVGINHGLMSNVKNSVGCRIHQEIINVILSKM